MENYRQEIIEKMKSVKMKIQNLIEKGNLLDAQFLIKEYEKAIPDDVELYSMKAVIAIMENRLDEAEVILKNALNLKDNDWELLYNLGQVYMRKGANQTALQIYEKVLQIVPTKQLKTEVKDFINQLKRDNAYTYYQRAQELENKEQLSDSALYYGLAYRYFNDRDIKEKIDQKIRQLANNNNGSLYEIFEVASEYIKKKFIILSSCPWGSVYQRMHHISRSLVKFGHEVLYITPGISISINNKGVSSSELTSYSLKNSKVVEGVKIYSPVTAFYNKKQVGNNYTNLVQNLLTESNKDTETVIISYLPYQVNVINKLKGKFYHIYECVDDHSDLEYAFWGNKKDIIWEQGLMDKADAITTTATSLYLKRLSVEGRKNVYMSRNAVNEGDFLLNKNDDIPEDLKNIPEPRIVYTGAIYEWFDTNLFCEIVKSNPDKSFVIIGFGKMELLKFNLPNLHFLGQKKHGDLKKYLKYMQIGIVPFKDNTDLIVNCDPIKQYEYLACGLPVITTYMPESAIGKIYTMLANTKEDFNRAIQKCLDLEVDPILIRDFIARNSWNARAALICRLVDSKVTEKDRFRSIDKLGRTLKELIEKHNHPFFLLLFALYKNLDDKSKYEAILKKIYNRYNLKSIERYYLNSLLENKKYEIFKSVVLKSKNIEIVLKKEIIFRESRNQYHYIKVIYYLCINDIKKALNLLRNIQEENLRELYLSYISYILGEDTYFKKISTMSNIEKKSPLFSFLNNGGMITYISDIFNKVSNEFINILESNGIKTHGLCTKKDNGEKNNRKIVSIKSIINKESSCKLRVIVPYDNDYIKQVRYLAENGISDCYVAVIIDSNIELIYIDKSTMKKIKIKEYNKTVTFNKFNAADSNIHALLKYMPAEYKQKYKLNVIFGKDVWSLVNIVKVPLLSNVTVSGFSTFLYNYPRFTYNIEVGHGGLQIKACGLMDKINKESGGTPELYNKVDRVCIASPMNKVVFSSFYSIPENKYEVTGLPRNDMLLLPESRINLEKLLGLDLGDKKIIFNMPTFREGSMSLRGSFKIDDFNYNKFDTFLKKRDIVCISKVHHGEEVSIEEENFNELTNIFFIDNNDLDEEGLDLYEVLGAGDILLTDYSTVYNDFLFMNKPTIFITTDIEEYRRERGLVLEPYDFWTAGPKVKTQEQLQEEIVSCTEKPDYYQEERERLFPVFFTYKDTNAIKRTWKLINRAINKNNINI